ncbi:DUF4382 domain-containing protein [Haloterrigena salinisoli]|uniref:DUF4382 domain-containing protein n=1 Tax=Haloterrigena salinisoli TaxID=3132747 RepID=UPI0030CA7E8B
MTTERTSDDRDDETFDPDIDRRTFIAAGGTVGATMLAGCAGGDTTPDDSSDAPDDGESDSETDESTATADGANFRLLVSDRPADIGDFDRLDVSFDDARIFDSGGEESGDGDDGAGSDGNESTEDAQTDGEEATGDEEQESGTDADDGEADEEETADGEDDGASADDETDGDESDANDGESGSSGDKVERRRGFYWLDLEGATVDLTKVVGDKAISVFEGGLSEGTYEKIELHVADVEGIVDGEVVDVKVPSEKLQIPHSFEVRADEPLEFVFDINVVEKGNGGYNLTPVISESGVAGTDVDIEEVGEDDAGDDARDEGADDDGSEANGTGTEEGDETESGASEGNESDESDANQ